MTKMVKVVIGRVLEIVLRAGSGEEEWKGRRRQRLKRGLTHIRG